MEILVGLMLVLLLIGIQVGMQRWNMHRLQQDWKAAETAIRMQDQATAEAALRRCIKRMPLWLAPRTLLAALLAERGELEEAEEVLQLVTSLEPKNADGYLSLSSFYARYQPDRMDDIIEALESALRFNPELQTRLRHERWLEPLRDDPRVEAILRPCAD